LLPSGRTDMKSFLFHFLQYANVVFLVYFLAANAVYTILMGLSLYAVSLHSKFAAERPYGDMADSPITPPITLIVPAYNEADAIVDTVLSLRDLNYPGKEILVVDDGSNDGTVERLIERFRLRPVDVIYRAVLKASPVKAFYHNPEMQELLVMCVEHGGKSRALNAGINMARSPYFCTVDADSVVERDALLRLMAPVVQSKQNTVVSGGIVRIANGCEIEHGIISKIDLAPSWLERCQTVEYIRTFLFGRPGWNALNATFITSGAFCLLHKESVIEVGGFSGETVTEDIDMIATLRRSLTDKKRKYRIVFTTDPICWTEAPKTIRMLARQRRRWQLGLTQTVLKNFDMTFNPRFGTMGMLSMPFHAYLEALGCVVEAIGTFLIPLSYFLGAMPLPTFLLFMFLAVGYGTLLSMGSVVLEELTLRRYPKWKHVAVLMSYAVIENLGYRQMVTLFRAHGVLQYFAGRKRWEAVQHKGIDRRVATAPGD
jgi:cellulose synthase/poly-beta-1,6-N-acetylglucosamine synthase-like glycosyltransferase